MMIIVIVFMIIITTFLVIIHFLIQLIGTVMNIIKSRSRSCNGNIVVVFFYFTVLPFIFCSSLFVVIIPLLPMIIMIIVIFNIFNIIFTIIIVFRTQDIR